MLPASFDVLSDGLPSHNGFYGGLWVLWWSCGTHMTVTLSSVPEVIDSFRGKVEK
jgi:hypothetical protein